MRKNRWQYGSCAVALGIGLVACGAEDQGDEEVGVASAALWGQSGGPSVGGSVNVSGNVVLAVDSERDLHGAHLYSPFQPVEVPATTDVHAAHGSGVGIPHSKGERYIDGAGKVFERTTNAAGDSVWQAVTSSVPGTSRFVDITARIGEALVVGENGQINMRFQAPVAPIIVHDPFFEVRIDSQPEELVSRIDVCSNGNVLAASKDGSRLFRLVRSAGRWDAVSLWHFPGNAGSVRILDVACGRETTGETVEVVVGRRGTDSPGVYRLVPGANGNSTPTWSLLAGAVPWASASRVDADDAGHVWYVGFDYHHGTKLWRKPSAGGSAELMPIDGTPADVGL
jgi:hypothetical protein